MSINRTIMIGNYFRNWGHPVSHEQKKWIKLFNSAKRQHTFNRKPRQMSFYEFHDVLWHAVKIVGLVWIKPSNVITENKIIKWGMKIMSSC